MAHLSIVDPLLATHYTIHHNIHKTIQHTIHNTVQQYSTVQYSTTVQQYIILYTIPNIQNLTHDMHHTTHTTQYKHTHKTTHNTKNT